MIKLLTIIIFLNNIFSGEIEDKIALENDLKTKIENLTEKIIGNKEFVVFVNIEFEQEKIESKKTPGSKSIYPGDLLSEAEYLPGITYQYIPPEKLETSFVTQTGKKIIKKVTIILTLDVSVKDDIITKLKKDITELIGLIPQRGDNINIKKVSFFKESFIKKFYNAVNPHIYWTILALILAMFLFGPLRLFFRSLVKAMEIRIDADARLRSTEKTELSGTGGFLLGTPTGQAGLGGYTAIPSLPTAGKSENQKHFSFINESNIKNLIYLLKNETPQNIAIVLSYLNYELANEILTSLSAEVQTDVSMNLINAKLFSPDDVEKIEQDLKTKIDYLVGGEDYFIGLLDQMDTDLQLNLINNLQNTNPELSERLRKLIFTFDDIAIFNKNALLKIIREIQRQGISLPIALKNASEKIRNRILECLSEGARAMLLEHMNLLGDVAVKRISDEQKRIIRVLRQLEKSGDISREKDKQEIIEMEVVYQPKKEGGGET